jgi:hypothetical protein
VEEVGSGQPSRHALLSRRRTALGAANRGQRRARAPHLAWFESVRATRLQTTPPTSGEEE